MAYTVHCPFCREPFVFDTPTLALAALAIHLAERASVITGDKHDWGTMPGDRLNITLRW